MANIVKTANSKLFFLIIFLISSQAMAMPKTVFLFRHAEKPSGNEGIHLSPKGYKRAKLLPLFFAKYNDDHSIREIYAQGLKNEESSKRPIETVTPTAEMLNLSIHKNFLKGDAKELVNHITKNISKDKSIIICWGHDELGEIARRLGHDEASEWPSKVFDRVWILHFNSMGQLTTFKDVPQKLLEGDSTQ